jgi:hypothetical protein
MCLKCDIVNGKFENQQLERNVRMKIKSFGRFHSAIVVKPKIKCSAIGGTLVGNINVHCTAASIQCV